VEYNSILALASLNLDEESVQSIFTIAVQALGISPQLTFALACSINGIPACEND